MIIAWADGVEYHEGVALREIVHNVWSSSVWISRDGQAYRKYYNAVTKTWGPFQPVPIALDASQNRFGIHLYAWMSLETAIATAWLHRAPDSTARVRSYADPPHVSTIEWGEPEEEEEEDEEERWRPLRWHCGLVPCDARYKIGDCGRLMNPKGDITRGFAALGTRWAAVKGAGLVNLLAAARLTDHEVRVPPRVYRAYIGISNGTRPDQHATRMRIPLKAAWDYYALAAPLIGKAGKKIVNSDLRRVLEAMRNDPRLGGRLLDLHPVVQRRLGRPLALEELRFARTCALAETT
jgi:hypothetical protein